MDIEQLFLKRQSTREFSDKEITDGELEKICRLATLAPSAVNAQPYNLYAINGAAAKKFTRHVQIHGRNGWADTCTAYIVIQSREPIEIQRGGNVRITNAPFIENDVGIIAAYVTLAAESLDIQSCIIGLRDEDGIADFLKLERGARFPLVIALGHAKDGYPVREKSRREFNQTYKLIK